MMNLLRACMRARFYHINQLLCERSDQIEVATCFTCLKKENNISLEEQTIGNFSLQQLKYIFDSLLTPDGFRSSSSNTLLAPKTSLVVSPTFSRLPSRIPPLLYIRGLYSPWRVPHIPFRICSLRF